MKNANDACKNINIKMKKGIKIKSKGCKDIKVI